jgi:phage host-nuclease inhibitor protein Gam
MPRNTARLKDIPSGEINTQEELDQLLLQICKSDAEIQALMARYEIKLAKLKEELAEKVRPLQNQRDELVRIGTRFVENYRSQLFKGRAKSLRLTHGKAGIRKQSGKLQAIAPDKKAKEAVLARALKSLQDTNPDCIKITKKIDLPALRKLGPDIYTDLDFDLVGAREEPYLEPSKEIVKAMAERKMGPRGV